jgi:hypothetical protein
MEYMDGVRVCSDCAEPLVGALPEETPGPVSAPDIRFVPLPTLPGRIYTEMIKGVLDGKGIPCYIRSDGLVDAYGISGTGPMGKGAVLYVPEDRVEECLALQHGMLDHV